MMRLQLLKLKLLLLLLLLLETLYYFPLTVEFQPVDWVCASIAWLQLHCVQWILSIRHIMQIMIFHSVKVIHIWNKAIFETIALWTSMVEPCAKRRSSSTRISIFFFFRKQINCNKLFSIHNSTQMAIAPNRFENVCNQKRLFFEEYDLELVTIQNGYGWKKKLLHTEHTQRDLCQDIKICSCLCLLHSPIYIWWWWWCNNNKNDIEDIPNMTVFSTHTNHFHFISFHFV